MWLLDIEKAVKILKENKSGYILFDKIYPVLYTHYICFENDGLKIFVDYETGEIIEK